MEQISAHWRDMLKDFDGTAKGLRGVAHLRGPIFNPLHWMFQHEYRALGRRYPLFGHYVSAGSRVARRQQRAFDLNMMRQCLTLAMCASQGAIKHAAQYVVIGDGYASLGSIISEANNLVEICFINIEPVLEMDRQFFAAAHPNRKAQFLPAESMDQMPKCLTSFDIACMGEINPEVRDRYCEIRSERSQFIYSCNRESKTFSDGTTTRFDNYDWRGAKPIVDERCPWHQSFYAFRPPFKRPYDGPFQHKLLQIVPSRTQN